MNYLLDNDEVVPHAEREFTLSTGSILGMFFGLVLLCGLFFGFGYSVGNHRSAPATAESSQNAPVAANFNAFKPAAGLPAGAPSSAPVPPHPATPSANDSPIAAKVPTPPASTSTTPAPIIRVAPSTPPAPVHTAAPPPAPASPTPVPSASGTFLVQIAAVSHQQDSALLMNALRVKGYAPSAFLEADKLIHVQLGPYSTRHDADVMRQRLVADGYSPIIK
jgi:cell division septation protein DedD